MLGETPDRYMRWFGGLSIDWDGETISGAGNRKADALMLYLMSHPRAHPRDALAGMLWEDLPQERALANLRQALTSLKKTYGEQFTADRNQVQWHGVIETDVALFVDACERWMATSQPTQTLSSEQFESLQSGLQLYQGELLAGFHVKQADSFMQWMETERERLHLWAVSCGNHILRYLQRHKRHRELIDWARKIIGWDELREEAHGALLSGLAHTGQIKAALKHYDKVEQLFEEQLGVDPGEELASLNRRLLRAQRREKQPFHIPTQHRQLLGRDEEQRLLHERLRDPHCRMLTLVGPGGIGKSTLAYHTLQELVQDTSLGGLKQVVSVRLEGEASVEQLERSLLQALHLSQPTDGDNHTLLSEYITTEELLILLDGFEPYIARGGVEWLIGWLEQQPQPNVTWVLTSREKLGLPDEWTFPVTGLGYEGDSDALVYFAAAAKQHRPQGLSEAELPWAQRICQLVEGKPLALQLAAGWLDRLSCQEIYEETSQSLDLLTARHKHQHNPRQTSIRAVFDATWERLSKEERATMCSLSLNEGDFSWTAALETTGASRDLLFNLCDRQLLHRCAGTVDGNPQEARYRLHDLMRQYAEEQHKAQPNDQQMASEEAFGRYYLQLLKSAKDPLCGNPPGKRPTQAEILQLLDLEWTQIKRAWRWAVRRARMDLLIPASDGLYHYSFIRAYFTETYQLLDETRQKLIDIPAPPGLDKTNALPPSLCRDMAKLLLYNSSFAERLLHEEIAKSTLERAHALLHGLDAPELRKTMAYLRFHYASQSGDDKQVEALRPQLEEALADDTTASWLHSAILNELAHEHFRVGEIAASAAIHEEALAHGRTQGDTLSQIIALDNLAEIELVSGRLEQARELFEQTINLAKSIGDREGTALATAQLARIACLYGEFPQAQVLAQEALLLAEEVQDADCLALAHQIMAEVSWARGRYNATETALREAIERQRKIGPGMSMIQLQKQRALLCWTQGDLIRGREVAEQALREAEEQKQHTLVGQIQIVRGWLFRSLHMNQQAQQCFQDGLSQLAAAANPIDLPLAYSGWGYAPDVTGAALEQAYERLQRGLQIASQHQLYPQMCHVLYEWAMLLIQATEERERPLLWLHQILRHPGSWACTRQQIHQIIAQCSPSLTHQQHQLIQQDATPLAATVEALTQATPPTDPHSA